jgi:hypothetical protein
LVGKTALGVDVALALGLLDVLDHLATGGELRVGRLGAGDLTLDEMTSTTRSYLKIVGGAVRAKLAPVGLPITASASTVLAPGASSTIPARPAATSRPARCATA